MLLGTKDRIMLSGMLQTVQANFLTLKQLRVLREELAFSDDEKAALKMVTTEVGVQWDSECEAMKELGFGTTMAEIVVKQLTDMDAQSKLSNDHVSLYEKFVEQKEK